MSHFEVAEEIRRTLAFSPSVRPMDAEAHQDSGVSFLRVTGQDGRTYGLVVRRIDELPSEITGEILTEAVHTAEIPVMPYPTVEPSPDCDCDDCLSKY